MSTDRITRVAAPSAGPVAAPPTTTTVPAAEGSALELSTGARTLGEMVLRAQDRGGAALRYKEGQSWREISYARLVRSARDIAKGLIALGIEPGERVSIIADTRPE